MKIIYVLILILITGCFTQGNDNVIKNPQKIIQPVLENIKPTPRVVKETDLGDFKVVYSSIINPKYKQVEDVLKECGDWNAFYEYEGKDIVICYELIDNFEELTMKQVIPKEGVSKKFLDTTIFLFYHELGHALIDTFDLPATGREEDAVDQLSILMLTNIGNEGEDAALNGATWLLLSDSGQKSISKSQFADEHSLGTQRFYNILCWLYAEDPEKYSEYIIKTKLPDSRANKCKDEYSKMSRSWNTLLKPYLKKGKIELYS